MSHSMWSIVPVRGIEHGKSRLIPALDNAERAALNRWLLTSTLRTIRTAHGSLCDCIVVSPCEQALELARAEGAEPVREPCGSANLNNAAALGAEHAAKAGASRIMVIACDLPELDVESLHALTAAGCKAGSMVIAPDKHRSGTNALVVDAGPRSVFHFGTGSFEKHRQCAAANGWTVCVVERPALAFDLDTPEDLAAWSAKTRATSFRGFACVRPD